MDARRAAALVVGALVLLASACEEVPAVPVSADATPAGSPDVKATDFASRPATPTPIPPAMGRCPAGVDPAACDLALQLNSQIERGSIDQLRLAPITITCPAADRWIIATEPQCSKDKAGKSQQGFTTGVKKFSFVDEAALRSDLESWLSSPREVAGIGCPRATEDSPLDCSGLLVLVLAATEPGLEDGVGLIAQRADGVTVLGARTGLALNNDVVEGGGWLGVGNAGLEERIPERVWVSPWQP